MRRITVFTAPWYPGHAPLLTAVELVRERLEEKDVELTVVDVDQSLSTAEEHKVVAVPTVVLFNDDIEKRRITGAIGMPEILGLAGLKSRARKLDA